MLIQFYKYFGNGITLHIDRYKFQLMYWIMNADSVCSNTEGRLYLYVTDSGVTAKLMLIPNLLNTAKGTLNIRTSQSTILKGLYFFARVIGFK